MRFIILLILLYLSGCEQESRCVKLLNQSKYWDYIYSAHFMDGGSISCTFINENGEVLHLWIHARFQNDYQQFFLKSTYDELKPLEITPLSNLEKKTLEMLSKAHVTEKIKTHLIDLDLIQKSLKDRNFNIRRPDPSPIPPQIHNSKNSDEQAPNKRISFGIS